MSPDIKYGIVGAGMMGIEHIMNLLHIDGVVVSAIADTHPASLSNCLKVMKEAAPAIGPEVAASVENVEVFHSAKDLFAAEVCDVAVIATPNFTHHSVLMTAFETAPEDMHILVEKPLCTTIADCKEVTQAARRRTGIVWVGLEYSYMPPVSRVISDTKRGVVGNPRMVMIREHRFPFLEKVQNWNRFNRNTGGTLVEKCCHFFDLFNRILAPAHPVRVFATGAQDVNHLDEVYEDGMRPDVIDNAYVLIDFSNGAKAALDLCMFAEASHCQEEMSIVGSKGKLEAFLPQLEVRTGVRGRDHLGGVRMEIVRDDRIKYEGHHHGSSFLEHLDVLATVRSFQSGAREELTAGLEQGTLSVAVGVAAHKSIDEGRPVLMKELLSEEDLKAVERYSLPESAAVSVCVKTVQQYSLADAPSVSISAKAI